MSLKLYIYSVLIVSEGGKFNDFITDLLPESAYHPVHFAGSISAAKRILSEHFFDFVIINAPLPDSAGTRLAIDTSMIHNAVVLLLVRNELYPDIREKVTEYGVFTLSKPVTRNIMTHALSWMSSARERIRYFEKKSLSLEEKMAEIRLVNRAKLLLISELKMSEQEAHRYIEKEAMNRCVGKQIIANEIVHNFPVSSG